eukprot:scaffold192220_cov28-Tisochrysis_lutea.AAC.1
MERRLRRNRLTQYHPVRAHHRHASVIAGSLNPENAEELRQRLSLALCLSTEGAALDRPRHSLWPAYPLARRAHPRAPAPAWAERAAAEEEQRRHAAAEPHHRAPSPLYSLPAVPRDGETERRRRKSTSTSIFTIS